MALTSTILERVNMIHVSIQQEAQDFVRHIAQFRLRQLGLADVQFILGNRPAVVIVGYATRHQQAGDASYCSAEKIT